MKRLSALIWLAILIAVVPLLALPLWLMKTLVVGFALIVAFIGYSLYHDSDADEDEEDIYTETPPTNHAIEAELPEEELEERQPAGEPINITDPDNSRFVASNTYQSRQQRLNMQKSE